MVRYLRRREMAEKPKSQIDKFKEAAKEAETDNSEEVFDRVLQKLTKAPPRKPGARQRAKRASDALKG